MKLIYLKSALKCDSFDVAIDIKIQFFGVLVTIEPGCSFTTVRYHELFDVPIKSVFICRGRKQEAGIKMFWWPNFVPNIIKRKQCYEAKKKGTGSNFNTSFGKILVNWLLAISERI